MKQYSFLFENIINLPGKVSSNNLYNFILKKIQENGGWKLYKQYMMSDPRFSWIKNFSQQFHRHLSRPVNRSGVPQPFLQKTLEFCGLNSEEIIPREIRSTLSNSASYNPLIKIISRDNSKQLGRLLSTLTDRERQILHYYSKGYNLEQIGQLFNVTKARINVIFNRAIRKIRSRVSQEPFLTIKDDFLRK